MVSVNIHYLLFLGDIYEVNFSLEDAGKIESKLVKSTNLEAWIEVKYWLK